MRPVGRHTVLPFASRRPRLSRTIDIHPKRTIATILQPPDNLRPTANPQAREVAVIGGGITGLTTAYQIARTIPHANVTLYEKSEQTGGWLGSEILEVQDGEILFEWGPKTIRPDVRGPGRATIGLLVQLGLLPELICIPKTAPAATNRFLYYPDHLVRMPGPSAGGSPMVSVFRGLYSAFTEPLFQGVVSGLLAEPTVAPRHSNVADESVGSFLRRRFGKQLADNIASAVFHGIYAGDLYNLSARTLLPALWYAETRDPNGNGVIAEFADLFFKNNSLHRYSDVHFHNLSVAAQDVVDTDRLTNSMVEQLSTQVSVYTFARGTSRLSQRLVEVLEQNDRVRLLTGTDITSISYRQDNKKITIGTGEKESTDRQYDYVVSTTSPSNLQQQLSSGNSSTAPLPVSNSYKAVDVMVVNLYFANPDLIRPDTRGFGYLLPRSIPLEQNPERALGVLFASESSGPRGPAAISHEGIRCGQDTAPGTKLTVMMGGHWWSGWAYEELPGEEEAIEMARSVLSRHLGISETPMLAKARLNKSCIPQYPVGYRQDMANIHTHILSKTEGRLKVAGTWWQGGVGVNDCVRKARLTALAIREAWDDKTGLEDYLEEEKFVLRDSRTNFVTMDPMQS